MYNIYLGKKICADEMKKNKKRMDSHTLPDNYLSLNPEFTLKW